MNTIRTNRKVRFAEGFDILENVDPQYFDNDTISFTSSTNAAQQTIRRIYKGSNKFAEFTSESSIEHYMFTIDDSELNPKDKISYVGDTKKMSYAIMDFQSKTFDWGSWKDAFFIPKPCILNYDGTVQGYLRENDYTHFEDGSAAPTLRSGEGNAMMEWPQIWIKVETDLMRPLSSTITVAKEQIDSSYTCYNCIDINGDLKHHFYTPIYESLIDDQGRLRSICDPGPTTDPFGTLQRPLDTYRIAAMKNGFDSNNLGYDIETYGDRCLITLLLWLMFQTTDLSSALGYGCAQSWNTDPRSWFVRIGSMNDKGMFYGDTDYKTGVKVFGMENWYGNKWRTTVGAYRRTLNTTTDSDYRHVLYSYALYPINDTGLDTSMIIDNYEDGRTSTSIIYNNIGEKYSDTYDMIVPSYYAEESYNITILPGGAIVPKRLHVGGRDGHTNYNLTCPCLITDSSSEAKSTDNITEVSFGGHIGNSTSFITQPLTWMFHNENDPDGLRYNSAALSYR